MINPGGSALLVGLAVVLWTSAVQAQGTTDERDAESLFKKAEIQFGLGNHKMAQDLYTMAYELRPQPSYLFNIGQCYHRLGNYDKAIRTFELYLFQEPEADDREDVQRMIEISRRAKLARRQPTSAPAPAVAGGPSRDASPTDRGALPKVLLWTGVGLSVAAIGAATVTGQLASDRSDEFHDPGTPADRLQGLKERGEALSRASIGCFAAGGALAVGTTLYYLLGYRRRTAAPVALVPLDAGGLVLAGSGVF